ncbi:short neuropeptide F-like isoform X1 [Diorhabda carinulata]|uniref:short neuropeptide F-like isoform X1 n=1 Tax=Diorhabda carinulata TaxID=1163345 RepID=UPI0025A25DCE|nr:short neuropeptide F-like isoform X1 [Diorhabda carinulata]XP_057663182.1 short neuropeptide F-like isoform X1 [Diorhabda carinulata]
MNAANSLRLFSGIFFSLIVLAVVSSAPYADYDNNINDLVEILMQKENIDDQLGLHQVERRRQPQLRLRFGKRSNEFDPFASKTNGVERPPSLRLRYGKRGEDILGLNDRSPSLRLRFGKRFDDAPLPVSLTNISEGEN